MTPTSASQSALGAKLTVFALADLCASIGLNPATLACLLLSPADAATQFPHASSPMRRLPSSFEPLSAAELAILNAVFVTRDDGISGSAILNALLRRFGHGEPWDRIPHVEAVRGHFYRGVRKATWTKVFALVQENEAVFTPDHVIGFAAIAEAEKGLLRLKGRRA